MHIESTSIMDVNIKYGKEKINFNLHKELIISERQINNEITEQPSHYAFLSLLLNKLETIKSQKESDLNKIRAKKFIKYKNKIDPKTNRPYNNDIAESKTIIDPEYLSTEKAFIKAKEDWSTIKSCVEAFNQRASLIQSLSANIRKIN